MLTTKEMLSAGVVVIALLLVAGWFLFGNRTSQQSATLAAKEWGDAYINNGPVLGCTYQADLKRVLVQDHPSASTLMMNPLVDSHRCVMFEDNEKVFIEHASVANLIAVRRPGEPDAYWMMSDRVRIE